MGLLPDTQNCGLRMCRECRERFPRHRLRWKSPVSDPDMHHSTCVTHVPWCMPGSLNRIGGENVPGIPGACTTRNFTYLVRGPCKNVWRKWVSSVFWHTCVSDNKMLTDTAFNYPDSKVHGANMGPIWGRQDPGGPHVSSMNFFIWVNFYHSFYSTAFNYHCCLFLVFMCNIFCNWLRYNEVVKTDLMA